MISTNTHSVFAFCTQWDFATAKEAVEVGNPVVRLCYVTTQKYRLYLVLDGLSLRYSSCVKEEHQWITTPISSRVMPPQKDTLFQSCGCLQQVMTKAFFLQFPTAEEGFYDFFPPYKDVISVLESNPTSKALRTHMYNYSCDECRTVEDADGVVSILVEEGTYMVPYEYDSDSSAEFTLQVYRGKLHPYDKLSYGFEILCERVEDLLSWIRTVNFKRFARFINNFGK